MEHGYHGQFASSMVCLTIAEGEEEGEERRPVDLLASPQVKRHIQITSMSSNIPGARGIGAKAIPPTF